MMESRQAVRFVDVLRCPMGDWQGDADEKFYKNNATNLICPQCRSRPLIPVVVVRHGSPESPNNEKPSLYKAKKGKVSLDKCWKCGGRLTARAHGLYCRRCGVYRKIRK